MPRIDGDRLLHALRFVAGFGKYLTGVNRPTFSPQDIEARAWLAEKMREAGLDATIDGVGNVIGKSKVRGPTLLIGSHSESECNGGWLDGILGVMYGIEIARAFRESPECAGLGIDVGVWADEEVHFLAFLGSRSFIDDLAESEIDAAFSKNDGTPLRDALVQAGYAGRAREKIDQSRYVGYLEGHIEQGDYLDRDGQSIGIVTGIVGLYQYKISFVGQQNHAGTTRMATRKDAGAALVRLANEINQTFPAVAGERSVWTVGQIRLDPGGASIIPGGAEMYFQFRDHEQQTLDRLEATLERLVEQANKGPCRCTIEVVYKAAPKLMYPPFQDALEQAAKLHAPGNYVRMPSAAAHDAQIIADVIPTGMLFVPSIGGISHHHTENTADADIVLGCQVMATAAQQILLAARDRGAA